MSDKGGFKISKPVSIWNRPLKTDFKDLFKSLSKAVVHGLTLNWVETTKSMADAASAIGLEKDAGQIAWLLIYRSIVEAMYDLVKDNLDLIRSSPSGYWNLREQTDLSTDELEAICQKLDFSLEKNELVIDEKFFQRPGELSVIQEMKKPFSEWLIGAGLSEAQAKAISDRLPTYFVYALNNQWRTRREDYIYLTEILDTPFIKASEREQAWSRYAAWLRKQVEEPMFYEAFSLKQVYIRPRAYYERKVGAPEEKAVERSMGEESKRERIIIDLEKSLEEWLNKPDAQDAITVISGGPGFGKSSFSKMFAARQSEKSDRRVLFVPLHRLELADDLIDAVKEFVEYDGFLPHNPLDAKAGESRLLVIFDGLDELSMQGKAAAEAAQQFINEVQRKTDRFNAREPRLKVLISGRELAVQANASEFRRPRQILHLLPYFVPEDSREEYTDAEGLLEEDQRPVWWQLYGEASGKGHSGIPAELDRDELTEITSQPLLNYLVALSFDRGKIDFATESNLNRIYKDLLEAVYERAWGGRAHPATEGISEEQFFRLLEEVAVAAWHGAGRTTTVREIEAHCESSGLKNLLGKFKEGAKEGVSRLLMAFYFRKSGSRVSGDETFEFTHKSFGEYLTARRIVRSIRYIHDELARHQESYESDWGQRDALTHWIKLCGPVAIDKYVFKFLKNEISLQEESIVDKWQTTLSDLISLILHQGTPMEALSSRPAYAEEMRQARNVEEALLAALNCCAWVTNRLSEIDWPDDSAFGNWISRLEGQNMDSRATILSHCLDWLNLNECDLHSQNFLGASLKNTNLEQANLVSTNFMGANLGGANIAEADLYKADLRFARLQSANLQGVFLIGAVFANANLSHAILKGTDLSGANLRKANLRGADLQGTWLDEAEITGANFRDANLKGASVQATKGEPADLEGAIWIDGRKIKGGTWNNLIFEEETAGEPSTDDSPAQS